MDDLRDYRFYAADMVHPSDLAVGYIWQTLRESCFSPKDKALMDSIAKITAAVKHRPLNPDSDEFRQFANKQLSTVREMASQHPEIDFSNELSHWGKATE